MDWRSATFEFDRLETLDRQTREQALGDLTAAHPELATFLRTVFERAHGGIQGGVQAGARGDAAQAAGAQPGQRIGPWLVERSLGAGGMGEVLQVRRDDGTYDQLAALKLIRHPGAAASARFAAERQRLARLEHPGIARIIDGGEDGAGRPYMVMELVDGAPIDRWCAERGETRTARIALIRQLCDALAHAHARLVLHRDIKPGNVLVTSEGQVRLIDFGIAALLGSDEVEGFCALTLATAAPEQLNGGMVSTATDIFQTGMLAHQLLLGRFPERQPDGSVAIDRAGLADPDLAAILAKATATEPDARYDSIAALEADFGNLLARLPVAAREGGALYRTRRFLARNALLSAMAALLVAGLVTATIVSAISARRANAAREETERYLQAAEESATLSRANQYLFELAYASPEDQQRLSDFMLGYADELNGAVDNAPQEMSSVLAVIAVHFNRTGQCRQVLQVAEPWLARDYGFPEDRSLAEGLAGNCLMQQGRYAEAAEMLRATLAFDREHKVGAELYPDTAVTLQRIALSTRAPADVAAFGAAMPAIREAHRDTGYLSYFAMLEAELAGRVRTLGGARSEFEALGEMTGDPDLWFPNFYHFGLARYAAYVAAFDGDAARARELIGQVEQLLGEGEAASMRARLAELEGALSLEADEFATAAEHFGAARTLRTGLFGEASYPAHQLGLLEAYALIEAGEPEAARALYDALRPEVFARDERTAGLARYVAARLAGDGTAPLAPKGAAWPCTDPVLLLVAVSEMGRSQARSDYCRN